MSKLLHSLSRLFRRFARASSGVAAVEAALLAPVVFTFVSSAAELSAMQLAVRALDGATESLSRPVWVGNLQVRSSSAGAFKESICNKLPQYTDCKNNLVVKMVAAPQLAGLAAALELTPATAFAPAYNPGVPGGYVALDATLTWKPLTPVFGIVFSDNVTFASKRAFRNEPFPVAQQGVGS